MKRYLVSILAAVLMTMGLAACGEPANATPDYAAACVDPQTQERLPASYCDRDNDQFLQTAVLWYMLTSSSHPFPAVGGSVNRTYFVTHVPQGKTFTTSVPKTGTPSMKSFTTKTFKSSNGSGGTLFKSSKSGGYSSKSGTSSKSGGFGGGFSSSKNGGSGGYKSGGSSGGFKSGGSSGGFKSGRR
jgi:predicted small lipoprotein YifL